MNYQKQVMSKDIYPSIFARQVEAILSITIQIVFATKFVFRITEGSQNFIFRISNFSGRHAPGSPGIRFNLRRPLCFIALL